MSNRY